MEEKVTRTSLKEALLLHIRAVKELHKVSPSFFPVTTCFSVVSAVLPYVTVYFSARILSELATLRREEILWKWVVAGVLCTGVCNILKAVLAQHNQMLINDIWGRKEMIFSNKMFSLDFADMDKSETHDLRTKIKQNENWSSWGLCKVLFYYMDIVESVIGILSGVALTVGLFLAKVPADAGKLAVLNHPLFILVMLGVILFINYAAGRFVQKAYEIASTVSDSATEGNRSFAVFGFSGLNRQRMVDMRMYNQQDIIDAYWKNTTAFGVKGEMARLGRGGMGINSGLGEGVTALFVGFAYLFTCLKAWTGAFDVGMVTQYVGAVTAMGKNVFTLIQYAGKIKTNSYYLKMAFSFLDIPNAMYQGSLTTEKRSDRQYEIEFRNVSFKYPNTESWALRNVSMKFKVGSRLAIVGENGSGKTTFIKLLCRLYDPQEGQILLNGIDIRKYNYRDYMDIFSIVFQDFQLLAQPLGANVAGSMTYDREKVKRALADAGFGERLEALPEGLDTYLYKEFAENGVDVSGGEAQKIAIARALYKDAPFIILDEPTAALDPVAEAEIYAKFNTISGDKTAIYISHRLSSCKFCDEIAVFHKGKVVQQGTHENLLSDEIGKYSELWHAQAKYYVKRECNLSNPVVE